VHQVGFYYRKVYFVGLNPYVLEI